MTQLADKVDTPPQGGGASQTCDRRPETTDPRDLVLARLWTALHEVEDPEIPVSVVGMGLIVAVDYEAATRSALLKITYTAMSCPAMDMIEDDVRARLLREPDVDRVEIEVVWDPVWTRSRLTREARATMRSLGIAV